MSTTIGCPVTILEDIKSHPVWLGSIPGLKAEKMLRGYNIPYLYVLRAGEFESDTEADFYVTYVHPDLTIKHQPFIITVRADGWSYENYDSGMRGPDSSIEDVLHLIMHCNEDENIPLTKAVRR